MILLFTNTNKLLIFFSILIGVFFNLKVFPSEGNMFHLPDQRGYIFWECEQEACNVYLKKNTENKELLLDNSSPPSISVLSKSLVELFFSCGSPCNYTIFYNSDRGISRSFEFSVAVNIRRRIVVVAENNYLVAYKIYDREKKPVFKIKRNWSPTATLFTDIIEAKFINDDIYIKYLVGKDFNEKEELIAPTYKLK